MKNFFQKCIDKKTNHQYNDVKPNLSLHFFYIFLLYFYISIKGGLKL